MKLLIAVKWQKSDTKLLENSSTAVLCWPQRKGDSTMTLGEKIASARKEKGMTQEMLAEQLGVTRQAVARWETGKALPGTANLFMLRQLLGIPLEAADMEATDLEGTTGTEKSGTLASAEKPESLTVKQKWMLLATIAILLWLALQFVGLGAAVGLLLLLLILMIVLFFIAAGKSGIVTAAKSTGRRILYLIAAMLLALVLWSVAFVASANYQSKAIWNMPQEEWQSYPAVAAWMQRCEIMGNGVYMQRVPAAYKHRCPLFRSAASMRQLRGNSAIPPAAYSRWPCFGSLLMPQKQRSIERVPAALPLSDTRFFCLLILQLSQYHFSLLQ